MGDTARSMSGAFVKIEGLINEKISISYGDLIRKINDCLNELLQTSIQNAEDLEKFIRQELFSGMNEIIRIIKETETSFISSNQIGLSVKHKIDPLKREPCLDESSTYGQDNLIDILPEPTRLEEKHESQPSNPFLPSQNYQDNNLEFTLPNSKGNDVLKNRLNIKSNANYVPNDKYDCAMTCDQCSYSSSDKSNLKRHIKMVHHKIKNYECENCDKTFTQRCNLESHIRSKHN